MPRNPFSKPLPSSVALSPASTTETHTTPSSLSPHPSIPATFTDNLPLPSLFVFDLDYTLWPFWVDTHVTPPIKPVGSSRKLGESGKATAKGKSRGYLYKLYSGDADTGDAGDGTGNANGEAEVEGEREGRKQEQYPPKMQDRHGENFEFYPGVPAILAAARERGIKMSLASRTHAPGLAREMLRGLYVPPPPLRDSGTLVEELVGRERGRERGKSKDRQRSKSKDRDRQKDKDKEKPTKPLKALDHFLHPQMYPGSKVSHFKCIQAATAKDSVNFPATRGAGVAFEDMLFFDDEARNRDVEAQLGVVFVLVRDGVTVGEVDKGVWEWRRRRGIAGGGGVG